MTRDEMIIQLIEHELQWMHDNFDKHSLTQVAEFFAEGGFSDWSDKELMNKYDLFIKEAA